MKFLSLAVVVILGFAYFGPAGAFDWVGFPERLAGAGAAHQCLKTSVGSHQVTYNDIRTGDGRYFHRHVVTSLDWIQSGDSMTFLDPSNADTNPYNINSQADCALVVSANDYNSFTYNSTHCIGFTYQASQCNVGPRFFTHNDTGTPFEIFVADGQKPNTTTQYIPDIFDFSWLIGIDVNTLSCRFLIDGLFADCPVTEIIIILKNGTELVFEPQKVMDINIFLAGESCSGQDITIIIKCFAVILVRKTFVRNECPGVDTCTGCVTRMTSSRSAADEKLSYRSLEEGCKKYKDHSVPIVTSELRRDQILSYLESDMDVSPDSFWVAFSRSAGSSSFTWPDGSTDLSMFGNGKTFTPRSGEDCASAYVDVVSMELMIDSVSCIQQRSGFCVQ